MGFFKMFKKKQEDEVDELRDELQEDLEKQNKIEDKIEDNLETQEELREDFEELLEEQEELQEKIEKRLEKGKDISEQVEESKEVQNELAKNIEKQEKLADKLDTQLAKKEEMEEQIKEKSEEFQEVLTEKLDEVQTEQTEEELEEDTEVVSEMAEEETQDEPQVEETEEISPDEKMSQGLKKTRRSFSQVFNELMANFRTVDEDFFEDLEETLITADVGYETAMRITDELRQEVKLQNAKKSEDVQRVIIDKLVEVYEANGTTENNELNIQKDGLTVILFVGVNGVGKTTSIGKLANQYREEGKKVLMAAADTFRAGAIDQLVVWGERAQVEVIRGEAGGDPAAVVFDAVKKAQEQEADILLVDTAGRLQNKVNLMNELEKIKRVIQREIPDAPHEVLLVLDATTGQNAMVQAKQFKEVTDVSGLVLSKLDGTAKGGIVLAIRNELQIPVKLVGLGEGINDLQPFKPEAYVQGLFKGLLD